VPRWREAIIPVIYAIAIFVTFRQYGITWDESLQSRYGEVTLAHDPAVATLRDVRYYGPLFETVAAAVYRVVPCDKYDVRHLLIALTGLATVIAAGRFCRRAGVDPLICQLMFVTLPQFYGHAFNNSKDIPLACAATWTMVAFARLLQTERMRDGVLTGIALGAAMGSRADAILLVLIGGVTIVAARRWRALVPSMVAVAVAWIVMVAVWPWSWGNPIARPIEAINIAAHFPQAIPLLFEGHPILSTQLPARYLAEMLAITTPIFTLLFAIAGAVIALRKGDPVKILAVAWIAVPLLLFIVARPNVYDGIRHFLFVVPAIAILAAIAMTPLPRYALLVAIVPLIAMIRLHPYQSTYFNAFAGGTGGASSRFDTEYGASSYREAAFWLRAHRCAARPTHVLVGATALSSECLTHYLPSGEFVVSRIFRGQSGALPLSFDYYVATTRYGLSANFDATPAVFVVERDGAAFTVIRGGCR